MGLYGTRRALLKGRRTYSEKVLGYAPIAYWPLWEATGTTAQCLVNSAQNGTYTGVTLANALGPDGSRCPFFDGANDCVNVYSVPFRDALNNDDGTALAWSLTDPAAWTDSTVRYLFSLSINGTNWIDIRKPSTANALRFTGNCAGSFNAYSYAVPVAERAIWLPCVITWQWGGVNTDFNIYVLGDLKNTFACVGRLTGLLSATTTTIGAASTAPVAAFHGHISHAAVWDRVLTPTQIADLAVV